MSRRFPARRVVAILLLALATTIPVASTAQPPAPPAPEPPAPAPGPSHAQLVIGAYGEAVTAQREGRFADYRRAVDRALALEPAHPILMLHMARACARTGDASAAGEWLVRLAATGIQVDLDADPDLGPLRGSPQFAAAKEEMNRQAAPQGSAEIAFRITERDFLPEGIAHDPPTGDFFVGSMRLRKIVRVGADGQVTDFVPTTSGALWSPVGMKVDAQERLLWVCDAAGVYMLGGTPADTSRTALRAFSLDDGRPVASALLPDTTRAHSLNDCAVAPDGAVYATDSTAGGVWVLRPGADALEPFLPADTFSAPNGLDFSPDGALLYVAEYGLGIAVVDLATLEIARLQGPPEFCTIYVDGLNWVDRSLVVVQNGRGLDRVARFFLDETGRRVSGMTVLAARLPEFDEPTTGAVANRAYCFVANSELNRIARDGALRPADPPRDFLIMRTSLQ